MITAKEIVLSILEEMRENYLTPFSLRPTIHKWQPEYFLVLLVEHPKTELIVEFKRLKKVGTIEISERTRFKSNGAVYRDYAFDIDLHTIQGLERLKSYIIEKCSSWGATIEYEEELNESNLSTMRQ